MHQRGGPSTCQGAKTTLPGNATDGSGRDILFCDDDIGRLALLQSSEDGAALPARCSVGTRAPLCVIKVPYENGTLRVRITEALKWTTLPNCVTSLAPASLPETDGGRVALHCPGDLALRHPLLQEGDDAPVYRAGGLGANSARLAQYPRIFAEWNKFLSDFFAIFLLKSTVEGYIFTKSAKIL